MCCDKTVSSALTATPESPQRQKVLFKLSRCEKSFPLEAAVDATRNKSLGKHTALAHGSHCFLFHVAHAGQFLGERTIKPGQKGRAVSSGDSLAPAETQQGLGDGGSKGGHPGVLMIPAGAKDFLESKSTERDREIWDIFLFLPTPLIPVLPVQIRRSTNLHVTALLLLYLQIFTGNRC